MAENRIKLGKKVSLLAALCLTVCTAALGLLGLRVRAAEGEDGPGTVRVVLPAMDSYGFVMEGPSGYYIDYLEEVAGYTGWNYDVRVVADEIELLRITEAGDYDLMLGIPYIQEAADELFRYSETAMGVRRYVLATTKEHPGLDDADLSSLMGLSVGVSENERNRVLEEKFKSFCYSNDLEYREDAESGFPQGVNLIHIGEEDRFALLTESAYDAVVTVDSVALSNDLYVILTFGNAPLFAVAPRDGNGEILERLQQVLLQIREQDPGYEERLYKQYFGDNYVNHLTFSEKEKEYLKQERNFRVAVWDGCAPYGYVDESGGWGGVSAEVYREIEEKTGGGLKFEFAVYQNSAEALAAVKNGECDIQGITFNSLGTAKTAGGVNSRTYYSDSFYMYKNRYSSKDMENASIVVKRDFPDSILKDIGVEDMSRVARADSAQDCLAMVNDGRADITFVLQKVADYYINYFQLRRLQELNVSLEHVTLCSIYGGTVDPVAAGIMDKCISHLDGSRLDRGITEYILRDHREVSFVDYIRAHAFTAAAVMIIVLAAVIALLVAVVITISRKSRRINEMLNCDDVTDGLSYRKFCREAGELLEKETAPLCVLFLDISNFKYINDSYGYEAGNRVLCAVNEFLEELAGDGAAQSGLKLPYARVYADHYAALLDYTDRESLRIRLERGLRGLELRCRELFPEFNVFVKAGVYVLDDAEKLSLQKAVNLANYAADGLKDLSKSEIAFYTEEMHEEVVSRQEIENDMRRAMEEGEFEAYYQSKVDVVSGRVIGAEALVRWNHKEKGLISPGRFVPVFEKNRFIIEVDFCVFEQVCALQADRMAGGNIPFPISCNFSRLHLSQPDFVDRLMEIVERYGVPPEYLELEITETVATDDFEFFVDIVQVLKQKGFLISIDDFGSGYSSIQLLYKLPIDVLKIDRVLVVDRERDENRIERELTKSIVNICRDHQIQVICEGVETMEQQRFVESCYNCHYVQGFLYSRPVCLEEFRRVLDHCGERRQTPAAGEPGGAAIEAQAAVT